MVLTAAPVQTIRTAVHPVAIGFTRSMQVRHALPRACDSEPEEGKTQVGSKAYYQGFLSTPLEESRGDGTEQAIKLGLSTAGIVGVLTVAFLASNGLL
eukprot:scaffold77673_cov32-Tisochrysis_lutea.AAC.2